MNLRIDFLQKTERRYQGIISTKMMVLGSAGVLLGTLVIVLLLTMITKASQADNFKRLQNESQQLSPIANVARQNQAALKDNQKTLARMDIWKKGATAPIYQILRQVQQEIPDKMELRTLRAGILQGGKEPSSYILRLSGRAFGEMVAVETKRRLTDNNSLRSFCGNIRLVSSGRESSDVWTFALEGRRELEENPK